MVVLQVTAPQFLAVVVRDDEDFSAGSACLGNFDFKAGEPGDVRFF